MAERLLKQEASLGAPLLRCDRDIGAGRTCSQLFGIKRCENAFLVGGPKWHSGATARNSSCAVDE
jgi:hypothetical protein